MKLYKTPKIETKNHFSLNYEVNCVQIYINCCIVCKAPAIMAKMPLSKTEPI